MKLLIVIIPFIIAMLLGRMIIPFIILVTYKKRLFDPIDERKSHNHIVPRLGGVAFTPIQCCLMVTTLVVIFKVSLVDLHIQTWAITPSLMVLICGLFILFLVGIGDDLIGVSYRWKFLIQIFVASLFPLAGLWINDLYGIFFIDKLSPWVGMPLTVFVVVLIINAVNLMDGLDGLCSGIVGFGCLFLGLLFIYHHAWLHALFAFITVGVLIPFFYYNVFGGFRRRQIFMGDTGSMTLGYSMAFLAISYAMNNEYIKPFTEGAVLVAFSVLIVPVLDVARVMYIRWRKGMPLFKPDRNHLHHKLLKAGFTPYGSVGAILLLVVFFCVFNIIGVNIMSNNIVLAMDLVIWLLIHYVFDKVMDYKHKKAMKLSEIIK